MMMGYHAPDEKGYEELTEEKSDMIEDLYIEVIMLRDRVKRLEDEQGKPDNAFIGQLAFDIMAIIGFVCLVMMIFGR